MENKEYQIIYADPPWEYVKLNFYQKKGINNKVYDRMKIEDIKALKVGEIADDNSLLFLWVTNPMLKKGLEVMQSWGFEFTTIAFVWVKTYKNGKEITGMGRYTRSCVELCLLGKKGIGVKREDTNVPQIVYSNLQNHSKKPEEIRERIINLCGDVKRIELFAREKVKGFDVWGNEVTSDIELNTKELVSIPPNPKGIGYP
jgi:N6-adenosine-specific RNA methylase IME4